MKTLAKITLAILVMAITTNVRGGVVQYNANFPETTIQFSMMDDMEGIYKLSYLTGSIQESIEIKFINPEGDVFFTDKVSSKKYFTKKYDLSELPAQTYTVIITDDDKTTTGRLKVE